MALTVTSNSFKDGDYLGNDFILSAEFGFGCAGGNRSPHIAWSGAPPAPRASRCIATTPTRRPARASGTGWW